MTQAPSGDQSLGHGTAGVWLRRLSFAVVALVVLLLMADRAPAPIVETPENPTPAPEQAPKSKRPARTKTATNENQTAKAPTISGPARFAGNWSGNISQGIFGTIKVSFVISADGTSVKMGGTEHPATVNGNLITWRSGWLNEIVWTLTLQGSASIALVTSKSGLGVNGTATFTRTQQLVTAPPPKSTAPSPPAANLPTAKVVSDKPGFVYNPFDPSGKAIFDVRNQTHGATVRDPASGKLFIVP